MICNYCIVADLFRFLLFYINFFLINLKDFLLYASVGSGIYVGMVLKLTKQSYIKHKQFFIISYSTVVLYIIGIMKVTNLIFTF